jgi:CPA2 family monovalent cation:H+ antiporter-2
MGVTPFGIALAPRLGDLVSTWPLPRKLKTGFSESLKAMTSRKREKLKDHLVIVGFGFNGRNLARAAKAVAIPYVIIEMNPKTVKDERKKGEPIFYGDATQESVLEQADVKDARIAVIVISDPLASSRITVQVRKENPKAFIIVRTRFVTEMKNLYRLGADQVIPEEFETSIEIFSRVLARYLIPRNEIEGLIAQVRADGYEMFRTLPKDPASLPDLKAYFSDLEVNTFRVMKGAPVEGKSLRQLDLRKKYGINLLAVQRDRQVLPNPDADTLILARDLLVVLARPADLTSHCGLFLNPASEKADECDLSSGDQQNT